MDDDQRPDFGPSGYLPDRAARQARKIILRAPLGLQWLVAAGVFGLVLLVAGGVFLLTRSGPPSAPFEPAVQLVTVTRSGGGVPVAELDTLVVVSGGPAAAFADLDELGLTWCERTRQVEGDDGRVWTVTGRGLDGIPSLDRHPTITYDGVVHVDPTRRLPGLPPSDDPATPGCP